MTPRRWAVLAALAVTASRPATAQSAAGRVRLDMPRDTVLRANARWPLRVETRDTALVTVMVAPLHPDAQPFRIESQRVIGAQIFWPLASSSGSALEPGAYRVIVTAANGGERLETVVRIVLVERMAPDTQPHPPVLDQMAFLPESSRTVSRRPGFLIVSGIGVAALATTWSLSDDLAASPVTIVVPSALAIGGLVGFLKGRPSTHALPANVAHNHRLVDDDAAARERIKTANARAMADAPQRVRVVDQP